MTTATEQSAKGRTLIGEVISIAMNKSITVKIMRQVKHPKYGKYIKKTTKIHAHDEDNTCGLGDKVMIKECRPISKTKAWTLVEVIEKVG
jgi:small subunit ribosomal protein S17